MERAIILIVAVLVCNRADAQSVRLKEYFHPTPKFKLLDKAFIAGVKDGLMAYNAAMEKNGRALFCMPPKLALTAEQLEEIMMRWVEKNRAKVTDEMPISLPLLLAFEETFSCQK